MVEPDDLALNRGKKRLCAEASASAFAENNVDRLSTLPEVLINQIVSLLPMEDAVRTDALSKKWNKEWTKMENFQFYDYPVSLSRKATKEDFMTFIERVLILLGNQVIKSFSLECLNVYPAERVHSWVTALLRLAVHELKIYCSVDGSLVFNPSIGFNLESLTELHLLVPCTFKIPTSFCFSSMKILHLCQVNFLKTDFCYLQELKLSFPVLTELGLWGCSLENVIRITINAPFLKTFIVGDIEHHYKHRLSKVVRRVRKSTWVNKFEISSKYIAFVSPSTIADIAIEFSASSLLSALMMLVPPGLLRQFCNLTSLTLSRDMIQCLFRLWEEISPQFGTVLHLVVSGGTPEHICLTDLLLHLPSLESLTVCQGNSGSASEEAVCQGNSRFAIEEGVYRECPLPRLKLVEFSDISGRKDEVELAKYLLKNADCLEEFTMTARGSRREREGKINEVKEDLLNFPRASANASLNFIN